MNSGSWDCSTLQVIFGGGKPYPLTLNKYTDFMFSIISINESSILLPNYYQLLYRSTNSFPFIHNLWLDIHYQAGIIPFCFLIIFHLTHLKSLTLLILQKKGGIVSLACLCLGSAYILYFMIEPIIQLAPKFFMASCFSLAYFRQIHTNSIKQYCKI